MALYYVRHDSLTQATLTFGPVETASDGSTAGPIAIPPGVTRIKGIVASVVVDGAQVTDTGPVFVLRLTGTGALPDGNQDLVLGSLHLDDGGGSLTYTANKIVKPLVLPCNIAVKGGADLAMQAAYYGTDAGSPQLSVELEFE